MDVDARVDTVLAGYRIKRLLGRGGMSVVYLADRVTKTVHVGGHPTGIAAGDGYVWVTVT